MGNVCRWLAEQAEGLGVEIFPGMAARALVVDEAGDAAGASSPASSGSSKDRDAGAELRARDGAAAASTCFLPRACAARSSRQAIARYGLGDGPRAAEVRARDEGDSGRSSPRRHRLGQVTHTMGWPLGKNAGGGSFMYHLENNQVFVGFVVHLNYENPYLYPYMEFQRFKHHPLIAEVLKGGKRVAYGARAISEGGWQSIPKLDLPGRRAARLLARASSTCRASRATTTRCSRASPPPRRRRRRSPPAGRATSSTAYARGGRERADRPRPEAGAQREADLVAVRADRLARPRRARHVGRTRSSATARPSARCGTARPTPRRPAGAGAFRADRLSEARRRAVLRPADQRRLLLHQPRRGPALPPDAEGPARSRSTSTCRATPSRRSATARPGSTRWCATADGSNPRFQINFQNCVHCKTCDIKDPLQNIDWTTPQGGDGPNYPNM